MFTKLVLLIVLIYSISSVNANTVTTAYLKDSIIPNELKALILVDLQKKCPEAISPYGLSENQTTMTHGVFEGTPYTFYTTQFNSVYYFDGMHPSTIVITVYSEKRGDSPFATGRIVSDVCEQ